MKAISSAEKSAMQAFSGWVKLREALIASEKISPRHPKGGRVKTRAANALKRVQRARAKQVKAIASDARNGQTELAQRVPRSDGT